MKPLEMLYWTFALMEVTEQETSVTGRPFPSQCLNDFVAATFRLRSFDRGPGY
jgi:hypothetical protein